MQVPPAHKLRQQYETGGVFHGKMVALSGYRRTLRGRHICRSCRPRPVRKIHLHSAVYGAAGAAQYPGGASAGPGPGRGAPGRRGKDHHDHPAEIRARRGGGAEIKGRGGHSGAAGGLRGLSDRRRRGPDGGRRFRPHGAHPLVRTRHPLRRGRGNRHPKGDSGTRHHRHGGHHRRQHRGIPPVGL